MFNKLGDEIKAAKYETSLSSYVFATPEEIDERAAFVVTSWTELDGLYATKLALAGMFAHHVHHVQYIAHSIRINVNVIHTQRMTWPGRSSGRSSGSQTSRSGHELTTRTRTRTHTHTHTHTHTRAHTHTHTHTHSTRSNTRAWWHGAARRRRTFIFAVLKLTLTFSVIEEGCVA